MLHSLPQIATKGFSTMYFKWPQITTTKFVCFLILLNIIAPDSHGHCYGYISYRLHRGILWLFTSTIYIVAKSWFRVFGQLQIIFSS